MRGRGTCFGSVSANTAENGLVFCRSEHPRAIGGLVVGAVRGRKFGRWVSKIGVERATDRRVKRSGEAGLLPPPHHRPYIQMCFAQSRQAQTKICRSSSLTSRGYRSANHWSWPGIRGGSCAYQFLEWITFRRWACCLLTPTGPGEGPWNSWISRSPRTVGTSVRPRYYSRGQGERRRLSRWLPSHTRQRENRSP